jgi:hypothetical protein
MPGFIVLPLLAVLVLVLSGLAFMWRRRQRAHNSGRYVQDLPPVSGQWLAERRRGG